MKADTAIFVALLAIGCAPRAGSAADLPQQVSTSVPTQSERQYEYDERGRIARVRVLGAIDVEYSYTSASMIDRITYRSIAAASAGADKEQSIKYRYDKGGRLTGIESGANHIQWRYDALSRPSEVRTSDGNSVAYRFDPWGRIEQLATAGVAYQYDYDILNNVVGVAFGKQRIHYEYKGEAREIVRHLPNGVTTTYRFSPLGELFGIRHQGANRAEIQKFRYEYYPDGRLKRAEESSPGGTIFKDFEYDLLGRLKKFKSSAGESETYDYDAMGNRIALVDARGRTAYEYDEFGRLAAQGPIRIAYDLVGNVVSRIDGTDSTTYTFDLTNRLTEVRKGDKVVSFAYDGEGNRIRKAGGAVTSYLYERLGGLPQVLAEFDAGGKLKSRHVLTPARIAQTDSAGRAIYLLEDHLGSTRSVVDEAGRVIARYDYSPFGVPRLVEGTPQTNYLFAGEQWDEETGLIYLRARYYDPSTGRFFSPDPMPGTLLDPQSFNQYVYAGNDPVNRVDPRGLFSGLPPPPPPQFQFRYQSFYEDVVDMSTTRDWYRPLASSVTQIGGIRSVAYPVTISSVSAGYVFGQAAGFAGGLFQPTTELQEYGRTSVDIVSTTSNRFRVVGGIGSALTFLDGVHAISRAEYLKAVGEFGSLVIPSLAKVAKAVPVVAYASPVLAGVQIFAAIPSEWYIAGAQAFTSAEARALRGQGPGFIGQAARYDPIANQTFLATEVHRVVFSAFADASRAAPTAQAASRLVGGAREAAGFVREVVGKALNPFNPGQVVAAAGAAGRNVLLDVRGGESLSQALSPSVPGSKPLATVGMLDRGRSFFVPQPPPGGGGGNLPAVGGVYLDQTARLVQGFGAVSGAIYDPASGQLALLGDKRMDLPPMNPEYLATAIRAVYAPSQHDPGMTIDPHPENPLASTMIVRFFGNTDNTRLGWVMFEADRLMKGYSIGADNQSQKKVQSTVPGYRSVTDMSVADPKHTGELWSRFWLVPEPVVGSINQDGSAIVLEPVKMRVRTETMRWDGRRLVPAGGEKDLHAEAFAEHFTNHYDDFARENPVFAELRNVATAVALAKWMKEQNVPVDWNFVWASAGDPYPTPTTTPSVVFEKSKTVTGGGYIRGTQMLTFGGVEMTPRLQLRRGSYLDAVADQVRFRLGARREGGAANFPVETQDRKLDAVAIPVARRNPELGSYSATEVDLWGAREVLGALPGLARHYNSFNNNRSDFGYSWTLMLPRLEFERIEGDGRSKLLSIRGKPGSEVEVQRFVLTSPFGVGEERFADPVVDESVGAISFKPSSNSGRFRGIYPEGDGVYRLVWANKDQALFDEQGRLRALLWPAGKALYDYEQDSNRLATIRLSRQGHPEERVSFEYDDRRRLTALKWREQHVVYGYDAAGNLKDVVAGIRKTSYQYDGRRLLTEVQVDKQQVTRNSYDSMGRLIEQEDGSGRRVRQEITILGDGGAVLKYVSGPEWMLARLDKAYRLTHVEDSNGNLHKYSLTANGNRVLEAVRGPASGSRIEWTDDDHVVAYRDMAGSNVSFAYTAKGVPSEVRLNGKPLLGYRYDKNDRLIELSHEGGSVEQLAYDESGRIRQIRRRNRGGRPHAEDAVEFSYDPAANTSTIRHPSMGGVSISNSGNAITVVGGGAARTYSFDTQGQLESVNGPAELSVRWAMNPKGDALDTVEVKRGGSTAALRRRNDGSIIVDGFDGGQTVFKAEHRGVLSRVEDPYGNVTSYKYNEKQMLERASLPSGRCIDFIYEKDSIRLAGERVTRCE